MAGIRRVLCLRLRRCRDPGGRTGSGNGAGTGNTAGTDGLGASGTDALNNTGNPTGPVSSIDGGSATSTTDGSTVELLGDLCTNVKKGTYGSIRFEFGCVALPVLPPPPPPS